MYQFNSFENSLEYVIDISFIAIILILYLSAYPELV